MNEQEMRSLMENVGIVVKAFVGDKLDPLTKRLDVLETGGGISSEWERAFLEDVGAVVKAFVGQETGKLADRIRELEHKLDLTNERVKFMAPGQAYTEAAKVAEVPYGGPWKPGTACNAGKFYTHRGSLWYAVQDSKGVEPGRHCGEFNLAVKSGAATQLETPR